MMSEKDAEVYAMRFPFKLWKLVNSCTSGSIQWGAEGKTILLHYEDFQREYMSEANCAFKTRNITSFIRQLNLYGFKKVGNQFREPLGPARHNIPHGLHEFHHDSFQASQPDLLANVSRKAASAGPSMKTIGFRGRKLAVPNIKREAIDMIEHCSIAMKIKEEECDAIATAPYLQLKTSSSGGRRGRPSKKDEYHRKKVARPPPNADHDYYPTDIASHSACNYSKAQDLTTGGSQQFSVPTMEPLVESDDWMKDLDPFPFTPSMSAMIDEYMANEENLAEDVSESKFLDLDALPSSTGPCPYNWQQECSISQIEKDLEGFTPFAAVCTDGQVSQGILNCKLGRRRMPTHATAGVMTTNEIECLLEKTPPVPEYQLIANVPNTLPSCIFAED